MSRSAFIASLTLHAGILFLAGWGWSSIATRTGSGPTGASAAFFGLEGGSLLTAIPAPPEPVSEPQLAEPEFAPPTPAVVLPGPQVTTTATVATLAPAIAIIPREIASAKPKVSPSKSGKSKRRTLAQSGGSSDGQAGSGAGGNGTGAHGAGYVPPQFRVRYKPLYPEEARAQRLEGTVLLLVSIDATGRVTSSSVSRSCGHAVLDRAALAAIRSWQFDPARQDGVAIFARVEVPIRFRFEERSSARS